MFFSPKFSSAATAPVRTDPRVAAAIADWDATFDKGDAQAMAAFYTSDALILPPSHTAVQTRAGIVQFFQSNFDNHVTGHLLVPFSSIDLGSTLVVSSNWSAHAVDANGKPISIGGLATHVFQVQADKSLKLRLHVFN